MAWEGARVALSVTSLLAGVLLLVLAVRVVAMDVRSRVYRSLAMFLLLRAFYAGLLAFAGPPLSFAMRVRVHFLLVLPFAALYVGFVILQQFSGMGIQRPWIRRTVLLVLVLGVAGVEAAYFLDRSLALAPPYPLDTIFGALDLCLLALMALLLVAVRANAPAAARQPLLWAALGFAIEPAFLTPMILLSRVWQVLSGAYPPSILFDGVSGLVGDALFVAAWLVVASAVWWVARRSAAPAGGPFATILIGAMFMGVAESFAVAFKPFDHWYVVHYLLVGSARVLTATFLAFGVVRHRVLEADLRLRIGIQRGVLATAFVATFFVAAEVAANALSDGAAFSVGGAAAAALLFAVHPLQRWADRVARRALPDAKSVGQMGPQERLAVYEEQATLAWMDGQLERKERLLLDRLRERLGVSIDAATDIERAVVGDPSQRRSRRPTSP